MEQAPVKDNSKLQKRKTQQFIICDKMVELEYVTN